jgi:hypothetical protein
MCNVLAANTIIEVLDEKIQNGELFTAYDVTLAARLATDENIVHNDVRNIVDNEFVTNQMAGYDRELSTLNLSSNPQAFVYFPDGKSANDHPLVDTSVTPSTVNTPVSVPVSTSDVVLNDDEYKTTKEGRVQIPRKLTNQVTPNGGTYDILINGALKCASSDARGDVRIGLRQFGIRDSKVKVTVDTNNNTIVIDTV